jgi:beta-glucosidase
VNYYSRAILRSDRVPEAENHPRTVPVPPPEVLTDMEWEVYPDGLRDLLDRVHRDYRPAEIIITENGAAYSLGPDAQGRIADRRRQDYLHTHLLAVHEAIGLGVPVSGYYAWSLLDNFEWAFGFGKRFGLVWVDYASQQRTPKDSAFWYRGVIADNAVAATAIDRVSA